MRLARSQMGQRTAGAMHEDGAVSGASQKNPRGRISIALTGRFRAAMTPLIDFSDSDYKVSAFRASSVETTETKGWAGACGRSGRYYLYYGSTPVVPQGLYRGLYYKHYMGTTHIDEG
jgi:hypothetical protein